MSSERNPRRGTSWVRRSIATGRLAMLASLVVLVGTRSSTAVPIQQGAGRQVAIVTGSQAGRAIANADGPDPSRIPWPADREEMFRDFFERVHVDETLADLREPIPQPGVPTPERVAARLPDTWAAPFRYVQREIAYVPYAGAVRGPVGTLIARAGNALDQALLLRALYRARGVTTRLVRGRLRWRDAQRLVNLPPPQRIHRGDPWIRWVETAADHWWIEARRGQRWISLDPAFADTGVGESPAHRRGVLDRVPMALQARATIQVQVGGRPAFRRTVAAERLLIAPVELAGVREPPRVVDSRRQTPPVPEPEPVSAEVQAAMASSGGSVASDRTILEKAPEEDPVADRLPQFPAGPVMLQLSFADQQFPIGPLPRETLSGVSLSVEVQVPAGPSSGVRVVWGEGDGTRLVVLAQSGRVSAPQLQQHAAAVWQVLSRLAAAESTAFAAWQARPAATRNSEAGMIHRIPPPPPPSESSPGDAADIVAPLHPAQALHVAIAQAWLQFDQVAAAALARVIMAAEDQLDSGAPEIVPALRLVGLSWQPAESDAPARWLVWSRQPVALGGVQPARRRGLQAARGVLSSAVLGQVINEIADRPPTTAFDITLRTVGTGSRLGWWQRDSAPPERWPGRARQWLAGALQRGYVVIGPVAPLPRGDGEILGWWRLDRESGDLQGFIDAPRGPAQGTVEWVEHRDLRDLESLLSSVRDLHLAARALIQVAQPDRVLLDGIVPRSCAATNLVSGLLAAGAPPNWTSPRFEDFCARGSRP